MTGKILRLNSRGFGFISHDGRSLFFHCTECPIFNSLEIGQMVEYEVANRNGRPAAINVREVTTPDFGESGFPDVYSHGRD